MAVHCVCEHGPNGKNNNHLIKQQKKKVSALDNFMHAPPAHSQFSMLHALASSLGHSYFSIFMVSMLHTCKMTATLKTGRGLEMMPGYLMTRMSSFTQGVGKGISPRPPPLHPQGMRLHNNVYSIYKSTKYVMV